MNPRVVLIKYLRLFSLFFLLIICTEKSFSQSPLPSPSPAPQVTKSLEKQFFKNIWRDQKSIWSAPFHLERSDAKWLIPFSAATIALIATDRRTAGEVGNGENLLRVSRDISQMGAFYTTYGTAAVFYLIGRKTNNPRARETGLLGLEALIDSQITALALKTITQRPRPLRDNGRGRFFHGGNSFPSGHSTGVWALAAVVGEEYRDRPLIRYGVYGMAAAVSVSRFTGRKHFLSDILIGGALGYGVGRFVYRKHHVEESDPNDSAPKSPVKTTKLMPLINPIYSRQARTYGLALSWKF